MTSVAGSIVLGLVMIGVGLGVPSKEILNLVRTLPENTPGELIAGASIFRVGLVFLGLTLITAGWLFKSRPSERARSLEPRSPMEWGLLSLILLLAAGLRFYRLDEGLWLDEILTQVNYVRAPFGEILTTYDSQNQHFLYSLLSHGSYVLIGEGSWSLRLPAVLFGVASVWALYLLGREVGTVLEALLCSAFFAVSYHHVWFSQNARGYTGLLFFTLLASWVLIRGLRENRPGQWVGYGVIAALGSYVQITMVLSVFAHFLIYLGHLYLNRRRAQDRPWMPLFGFLLGGVLTFQLYALVLPQMLGAPMEQGRMVADWRNPLWTLMEFVKGSQVGLKGFVPGIVALGIFIAGLRDFGRRNPIMVELLIIPAGIVGVTAIAMGHHLWPRLFFFSFGFIVLILCRGCLQLAIPIGRWLKLNGAQSAQAGAVLFLMTILASAISLPSAYGPKQDYSGALEFVERNRGSGDVVFAVGDARFAYKEYYRVNWSDVRDAGDLEAALDQRKPVWIVYTFPLYLETAYPDIMKAIHRDFATVEKFEGTLNGGTIYVGRNKLPRA